MRYKVGDTIRFRKKTINRGCSYQEALERFPDGKAEITEIAAVYSDGKTYTAYNCYGPRGNCYFIDDDLVSNKITFV